VRRVIYIILMLGLLLQIIRADFHRQEQLFLPWGDLPGQIPLKETPAGWQSVESFEVIGQNSYLLLAKSGQIQVFLQGKFKNTLATGLIDAQDFQMGPNSHWRYCMNAHQISVNQGQTVNKLWENSNKLQPNSRIIRSNKNNPAVLLNLSETVTGLADSPRVETGVLNRLGQSGRMIRHSETDLLFLLNGQQVADFHPAAGSWGSGQYLGCSQAGIHYILVERILRTYPLKLQREIFLVDGQGQLVGTIAVPPTLYAPVTREFQLDADGTLHELITARDGVHIISWMWQDQGSNEPFHNELPVEFNAITPRPFQGDQHLSVEPTQDEKSSTGSQVIERLDFPPVTREEALNTADQYVALVWTASAQNLTNGQINDPDGHAVQTPDWIHLGQNQHMVYQWGGFSTINNFVDGLAAGKYAGDMATSAVSNYAVGVDCSGFVCRCWHMPQHYSTWMMSNTQPLITQAYDSWYDLEPGDAIHKVGHVRLAVLWNGNGTLLAVEAGGAWITDYHTYSISQLSAYQPRYYVNMVGTATALTQPVLACVTANDSLGMSWSLADTTGITGLNVYQENIFSMDDWTLLLPDPVPVTATRVDLTDTDLSLAYQLRSVGSGSANEESYPSDTYACATKDAPEKLLIVDGFDRTSGSYPFPYHDFAARLAKALGHFTLSYATADNDAVLAGMVDLAAYDAVFWLLGDESTVSETFSSTEQNLVRNYLIQGGRLFVSGSEVGWDLDAQGSSSDQAFFHNYLKAALGVDDSQSYTINGVTGTPFAGITLNYDDGSHGVYAENFPDAFLTNGGSQAVLRYANNMIAATAYTGTFAAGSNVGQVVLLGIPFETIYQADQRLALMTATLDYFGLSTVLALDDHQPQQPVARLMVPYPNPFNSNTQIRFQLQHPGRVTLQVFDLQGRLVRTLGQDHYAAGSWQIPFQAGELSSGVYLVRLQAAGVSQSRKIIYLK